MCIYRSRCVCIADGCWWACRKQRQKMQNHLHQSQNQCVEQPNRTLANGPNHPGPGHPGPGPEDIPMVDVSRSLTAGQRSPNAPGGQRSPNTHTPGFRGHHHPTQQRAQPQGSEVTRHNRVQPQGSKVTITPEGSTPGGQSD